LPNSEVPIPKWNKSDKKFKLGIKLPKSRNERATNRKIPFKMKRKIVVVKSKKMNVKMKVNYKRNLKQKKSGKHKWKLKLGIYK
jgi:hypothetical protein